MVFVRPSSKIVDTEHSDTGCRREIGRVAPPPAACIEQVVSTVVFATEQCPMSQECDAQSGTVKIEEPVVSATALATEQCSMPQECDAQYGAVKTEEPGVSTTVFATEQRSMPQECAAQYICMCCTCPSSKIVVAELSDMGPQRKQLLQCTLNPLHTRQPLPVE